MARPPGPPIETRSEKKSAHGIYIPVADLERLRVLARRSLSLLREALPLLVEERDCVFASEEVDGVIPPGEARDLHGRLESAIARSEALIADLDKTLTGKG